MPIRQGYTTKDGERVGWYRWGDSGKKYHYEPGNRHSRLTALGMAKAQQSAAYASGYSG